MNIRISKQLIVNWEYMEPEKDHFISLILLSDPELKLTLSMSRSISAEIDTLHLRIDQMASGISVLYRIIQVEAYETR